MNEKQMHELIAAAAAMRADLYNKHCADAANQEEAVVCLASQLMFQAQVVLGALYNGDMDKVREHWLAAGHCRGAESAPTARAEITA